MFSCKFSHHPILWIKNMHIHSYYTSSMDVSWCIHSYSSWHPFKQICPIFVKQHVDILMCNSVEQWWRLEPIPAWKKYPLMATQRVETYVIAILNHFSRVLISRFYLLGRLMCWRKLCKANSQWEDFSPEPDLVRMFQMMIKNKTTGLVNVGKCW